MAGWFPQLLNNSPDIYKKVQIFQELEVNKQQSRHIYKSSNIPETGSK